MNLDLMIVLLALFFIGCVSYFISKSKIEPKNKTTKRRKTRREKIQDDINNNLN